MAMIDTYRSNVARKRDDIAKLTEQKARERKKIADLSSKIHSATRLMNSTTSASTKQSKLSEILRYQGDISKVEKNIADYEHKISQKNKEIQTELKKLSDEEIREAKKAQAEQTAFRKKQLQNFSNVARTLYEHHNAIQELKALPEEVTVLFFAANPRDQVQLSLDEEVRSIKEMISKAKHRDAVKFESCWAVRPGDVLQHINQYQPTIVHFSGHGSECDELVLMDNQRNTKLVSLNSIVHAMSVANDNLRLVFFNTCFSNNQASNVVNHVEAAIGMQTSITDDAARVFAASFYSAIGFGLSLEKSFNQAKAALMLEGIAEEETPQLFVKDGLDPKEMFIVSASTQ